MPHFDEDGNDTALCQECGREFQGNQVDWLPIPRTEHKSKGNLCKECQDSDN
jgi:DNA-directed RNA polymerase subunit RPC12/RpoP